MTNYNNSLNSVFRALTDPTRRAVLDHLSRGPLSVKQLAKPFKMALPSFSQHLDVLEECGLVKSSKTGRIRTYVLETKQLKTAEHWLSIHRKQWEQRLDALDEYLKTMKEE